MIDADAEWEPRSGINTWISFTDLFAGLLLITILGIIVILPSYKEVRFSRELVKAMNQATKVTRSIQERLPELLPGNLEKPLYSETEIIIPSAALFRSFGFDDFLYDEGKKELLTAIRTAIQKALQELGA